LIRTAVSDERSLAQPVTVTSCGLPVSATHLRCGLAGGEIVMCDRPVSELRDWAANGAEVLARSEHPTTRGWSFVNRLDVCRHERHVVEAIIGMAQARQLNVVAEGVESSQQRNILGRLGCQLAQGYLYGSPMLARRCAAWTTDPAGAVTG